MKLSQPTTKYARRRRSGLKTLVLKSILILFAAMALLLPTPAYTSEPTRSPTVEAAVQAHSWCPIDDESFIPYGFVWCGYVYKLSPEAAMFVEFKLREGYPGAPYYVVLRRSDGTRFLLQTGYLARPGDSAVVEMFRLFILEELEPAEALDAPYIEIHIKGAKVNMSENFGRRLPVYMPYVSK